MDNKSIQALHQEWQKAVRRHTELLRDTRGRGLSQWQIQKMSKASLVEVDAAYARLKAAEARPAGDAAQQFGAALRAMIPTA